MDHDALSDCRDGQPNGCTPRAETGNGVVPQQPLLVGAVDGSGIVDLSARQPSGIFLQLSTLGGYDTALLDKQGLSSGFVGGQASIGKLFVSNRSSLLLQDSISATSYLASGPTTALLNQFSAAVAAHLNETWSLQATGFSSYGNDSLRTVAPLQQQAIGSTSGIASEAASYGLYAGDVFTAQGALALHRQISERSGWTLSGTESNLRYFDIGSAQNTLTGRADYLHLATRNLTYGFYGVAISQSGALLCASGGGGVAVAYRPSRMLELNASGGPVSGSGACARSLQFLSNGSVSVHPTQRTAFYITADRHPNNGVLPQTQWITSVTGGIQHSFKQRFEASSNYAYNYGSGSRTSSALQESYVAASLKIALAGGVSETFSIRHYANSGFAANPDRTVALFSLWWTPLHPGRSLGRNGNL